MRRHLVRPARAWTLLWALCACVMVLPLARAAAGLAGDCNGDGMVTITELITAVDIALDVRLLADCLAADADGSGHVAINDLVADVSVALGLSAATPKATGATPSATATLIAPPTDTAVPSPTPTLALVVLNGTCLRPAETKQKNLRFCDDGTPVQAALCTNPKTCLHDPAARAAIGSTTVAGGAGQFAVEVSQAVASAASVVFEADLLDAQQVVFPYYAVYSFGSVGTAGSARAPHALREQAASPAGVTIDPSSEGTARVADLRGLDQFASGQVEALADEVRQDPRAQYGDLSLGCAADLGAGIAASFISRFFQGSTLAEPGALAMDAGGNVFVAGEGGSNVFRITPGGAIQQIIDATGDGAGHGLSAPDALAVDAVGNVFVGGGGSSNVFRITPGGAIQQIIDATGDGGGHPLNRADALAVDAAGNVFVAGLFSNNVFRITPGGAIQEIIDTTGDGAGHPLAIPDALAVDAAGNVFVGGGDSSNVFRITPGGAIQQIIDATGDGAGHPLYSPGALAVDAGGNVFVAGAGSSNVFRITPGGAIQQIY